MTRLNGDEVAKMGGRRRRRSLDRWLMETFGTEWCGSKAPPLTNRSTYIKDDGVYRVFSMQDDGGFVGIGYPDQWHVIMRTKAARMFALWTLRVWLADWCGLRSWLYYRGLHHSVSGKWEWFSYAKRTRRLTRPASYEEWRLDHEVRV